MLLECRWSVLLGTGVVYRQTFPTTQGKGLLLYLKLHMNNFNTNFESYKFKL